MTEKSASNVHQIFQNPVENVAGRDVVINHVGSERPFSNGERRQLGDLIKPLAVENQTTEQQEWRALHFPFGVNSIDEMNQSHFEPAKQLLTFKLEAARLRREQHERYKIAVRQEVNQKLAAREQEGVMLRQQCNQLVSQKSALETTLANLTRRIDEQALSVDAKRLQQQLSHEMQERRHAQAEIGRSAHRVAELERQVDNLIAGKSSTAQALEEAQSKAEQAQRVVSRLRSRLIGGGALALLAIGTLGMQAKQFANDLVQAKVLRPECQFGGVVYSWGTRLKTTNGVQKCVKSRNGQYLWQPER